MLVAPIVIVCSIGLLTSIFKIVEKNMKSKEQFVNMTINGREFVLHHFSRNDSSIYDSAIDFCSKEGTECVVSSEFA